MSENIRFDGRVAVVTGAGGGLGKIYALMLAARGAKVVVNDLGCAPDGSGGTTNFADQVVEEIKSAGGEAVADYNGVHTKEGAEGLIKTALDAFGKVDIVINNAGILRDRSFMKMTDDDWKAVIDVHLHGTYNVTKAVWPHLRENQYGRVVFTTSSAGLYGNFGQANYSAAKLGIVGLMNTLKLEGEKYNIKVNTIAPFAGSRLTATVLPQDVLEKLKPEYVAPIVIYMCWEGCQETGRVFVAGAGYFSRAAIVEGPGVYFNLNEEITPEKVAEKLNEIKTVEGAVEFNNATEATMKAFKNLGS